MSSSSGSTMQISLVNVVSALYCEYILPCLSFKEIGLLDTAFCNKALRNNLLYALQFKIEGMENHIHTCFESILWLAIRKSPPLVIQTNGFYSETQNLFLAGCLYSNQSHNDQHLFNGEKQTPTSLYNESDVSDDDNNDEYIDANIVINEYRYMFVEYLYRLPSADVNFRDHFTGQSALHYACKTKDYELLHILL